MFRMAKGWSWTFYPLAMTLLSSLRLDAWPWAPTAPVGGTQPGVSRRLPAVGKCAMRSSLCWISWQQRRQARSAVVVRADSKFCRGWGAVVFNCKSLPFWVENTNHRDASYSLNYLFKIERVIGEKQEVNRMGGRKRYPQTRFNFNFLKLLQTVVEAAERWTAVLKLKWKLNKIEATLGSRSPALGLITLGILAWKLEF